MPNEEESKKALDDAGTFREEDPSRYYEIIGKLGAGGFARVFKVQHKKNKSICALKFIEPKNQKERNMIKNEVGLMMLCKDNHGIIKCLEAFDYKSKLWLFLEIMDEPAIRASIRKTVANMCY
eukprot:CAMPEP_0116888308 /NCGR_PEP_ID=MMETSP0463-20121206/23255_1 /TAXON_ID=181622 /ORGANISM="Strombidinopsis sp, Strain SopsisLIS2011" /LENGTH=122 /DNA_ID=CAMNT_0004552793 /DNA_START=576 /DNA_END=944 /DNA_ORIENTATION=+